MVKAKRSKTVSLTQVKPKKKEFKEKLISKLSKLYYQYKNVYVIQITN